MYEAGIRLAAEMKKLTEHDSMNKYSNHLNKYFVPYHLKVSEIAKITADVEQAEKNRYELQTQLWDVTLFPILNSEEFDQKKNQVRFPFSLQLTLDN
jgi:hypothetical protein